MQISLVAEPFFAFSLVSSPESFSFCRSDRSAAQLAGKGSINGKIADSTGAAASTRYGGYHEQLHECEADDDLHRIGRLFLLSRSGEVHLTITMKGFKGFTQENVNVDALQTFTVDVTLTTGEVNESVTVTACLLRSRLRMRRSA